MAKQDMLRALEQEEQDLTQELQQTPAFKRLEAIRQVLALYRTAPSPSTGVQIGTARSEASPPGKTVSAIIAEAAEKFLKESGRRYTSSPLTKALQDRGVHIPGKYPPARVASVLASKRKIFNNVEGEGYGLVAWGNSDAGKDDQNAETPDPDRSGAPKTNGSLPLTQ